ncbi:MAG: phosphoribosylanthranilate isomerase [Oscillospiraceae bacterium]|nr:phosphoribosylanthranilate isomerase [Oscillospiraceae bacterium]
MTKIKICGLTRVEDIEAVNIEKPDYIGFVFAESVRKITPDKALKLRRLLNPDIVPVGVFVNEMIETILSILKAGAIDVVQLHGAENDDYILKLKSLSNKPIIKAYGNVNSPADYLLFDSITPGSGQTFDWNSIEQTGREFFLAGGLNPENVAEAIAKTSPFAVDVSSGVETNGLKNPTKIKKFIKNAKGIDKHAQ